LPVQKIGLRQGLPGRSHAPGDQQDAVRQEGRRVPDGAVSAVFATG
jgi:hypothetical protein